MVKMLTRVLLWYPRKSINNIPRMIALWLRRICDSDESTEWWISELLDSKRSSSRISRQTIPESWNDV